MRCSDVEIILMIMRGRVASSRHVLLWFVVYDALKWSVQGRRFMIVHRFCIPLRLSAFICCLPWSFGH